MNDTTQHPSPDPASTSTVTPRRRILTATVVWGCILLLIAALYGAPLAFDLELLQGSLSPAWLMLGLGVILVIGGLAAALTRRR